MIQRIQSLYLLLAAVAVGLTSLFTLGEILVLDGTYRFSANSLVLVMGDGSKEELVESYMIPVILIVIVGLGALGAILLYSNRKAQVRVIQLLMFLNASLLGAIFYYQKAAEELAGAMIHYTFGIIFPIVSLVFLILATRSIRQDEELVKAADRLR